MTDFEHEILKLNKSRKTKVNNSLGVYDAYKWIRKNKWFDIGKPVTEHEFYYIIRTINKELVNLFLKGYIIKFPLRMGVLELRKYSPSIKIINNKLKINLPIDWKKTLQLWKTDKESFINKTLLRKETKEVFKIIYNKNRANFNNKSFYNFTPCRAFKQSIKKNIKNNVLDAFNL